MTTAPRLLDCLLRLALATGLPAACGGGPSTPSATPASPTTQNGPQVTAPQGSAATLDGTISPDEWVSASRTSLAGGAEMLMMHSGGYLYLGFRPKEAPVVSICLDRRTDVTVMHTSGSLGTATYRRQADGSYLSLGWAEWCCGEATMSAAAEAERAGYLQRRGWVAPNGNLGALGDMEVKLALPSTGVRLALTYADSNDMGATGHWPGSVYPTDLSDDCAARELVTGNLPACARFQVDRWALVTPGASR